MAIYKTDQLWIEGLIRREREAMAILYDRYGALCWSLFLRMTRDAKAAEFLMEELFLRIPVYAKEYGQSQTPYNIWIFMIARGMGIEFIRCQRANCHAIRDQSLSALDDRQMLELAYLDGWSLHEMAAGLNTSVDIATNRVRTAFRNMKAALMEQAQ
jgi:DNA-directed RNA polymerase specialized sigma24 family protein